MAAVALRRCCAAGAGAGAGARACAGGAGAGAGGGGGPARARARGAAGRGARRGAIPAPRRGRRRCGAAPSARVQAVSASGAGAASDAPERENREGTSRRAAALLQTDGLANAAPTILVAEKLGEAGLKVLEAAGNVDKAYGLTPDELLAKVSLCDALVVRSSTRVTREVIEAAKGRLRVVGRAGVGVENVDLEAASEAGVTVVNAPTANTVAAAEHAVALLCALARNVPQADASLRRGEWARHQLVGVSLYEKTVVILGFGSVGYEVGRRLKGLGMRVLAYDPYASRERAESLGVELVTFEEALARGDFFSLHVPLTQATERLFDDEAFEAMRPGARIVNVARGGVVDEEALARALDVGTVAAAALDVFVEEPPPADHPLVGRADVIVTPHLGGSTAEAQEGVATEIAEAVVATLNGSPCATAVNTPAIKPEAMQRLAPYAVLAHALGRMLMQIAVGGITDVSIEYRSASARDDLDTRLLRAMVIKGLLEPASDRVVNAVNADLVARQRGIRVSETVKPAYGEEGNMLTSLRVRASGMASTSFSSASLAKSGEISLDGAVVNGAPQLIRMGDFGVSIRLEGSVLFCRQRDQAGMIGAVGSLLGAEEVNVNHMAVGRVRATGEAVMAIGVDDRPSREVLAAISNMQAIAECILVSL